MREMTVEDLAKLLRSERQKVDTYRKDIRFLSIALNLSGKRKELEAESGSMIDKYGMIKALKESNSTQKEDFTDVLPVSEPEKC